MKLWEGALLLLAVFALFRPNFFMDNLYEPYAIRPAKQVYEIAEKQGADYPMIFVIKGTNVEGDDVRKTVSVTLGKTGDARQRLSEAGITFSMLGDEVRVGTVKFGSRARRAGFEQGWVIESIKVDSGAPSEHWVYIPALAIVAFVFFWQRRRMKVAGLAPA
jgi:hypothetical protein